MSSGHLVALLWVLLTVILGAGAVSQLGGCDPVVPSPLDAGAAPAVLDMSAPQLLDLAPVAPACVPCSWTETINGCTPSRCALRLGGQLCCALRRRGSQTGRRRWRAFARSVRRREPGWRGSQLRRHRQNLVGALRPRPQRQFSPLSLVGMSMAARKRAARRLCFQVGDVTEPRARWRGLMSWADSQHVPIGYRAERAKFRIGERLRPCPAWRCALSHRPEACICRGSGVRPAQTAAQRRAERKSKRKARAYGRLLSLHLPEQDRQGCSHPVDEWLKAGKVCPGRDEKGVCNGIPF